MKLPFSLFFYFWGSVLVQGDEGICEVNEKENHRLQKHFNSYPSPLRQPDEFTVVRELDLNYLSAQLFGGRQSKWMKPNLRILDVGGGTGDGALMLAWQLEAIGADYLIFIVDIAVKPARTAYNRMKHFGYKDRVRVIDAPILSLSK